MGATVSLSHLRDSWASEAIKAKGTRRGSQEARGPRFFDSCKLGDPRVPVPPKCGCRQLATLCDHCCNVCCNCVKISTTFGVPSKFNGGLRFQFSPFPQRSACLQLRRTPSGKLRVFGKGPLVQSVRFLGTLVQSETIDLPVSKVEDDLFRRVELWCKHQFDGALEKVGASLAAPSGAMVSSDEKLDEAADGRLQRGVKRSAEEMKRDGEGALHSRPNGRKRRNSVTFATHACHLCQVFSAVAFA